MMLVTLRSRRCPLKGANIPANRNDINTWLRNRTKFFIQQDAHCA
jgi:hypothetical protein